MLRRLSEYGNWLFLYPAKFWLAVAPIPGAFVVAVMLCRLVEKSGFEPRIRLAGMVLELLGLLTVVIGLRHSSTRFKKPTFWLMVGAWWDERPRRNRRVGLTGISVSTFGGSATGSYTRPPRPTTTDERLKELESRQDYIEAELNVLKANVEDKAKKLTAALDAERKAREEADSANRDLIAEATAGGVHLALIGSIWIALGIFLATATAEIVKFLGLQ